jgi:hypothetical protein
MMRKQAAVSPRGRSLRGRMVAGNRRDAEGQPEALRWTAAAERGPAGVCSACQLAGAQLRRRMMAVCISCVRSSPVGAMTRQQQPCMKHFQVA